MPDRTRRRRPSRAHRLLAIAASVLIAVWLSGCAEDANLDRTSSNVTTGEACGGGQTIDLEPGAEECSSFELDGYGDDADCRWFLSGGSGTTDIIVEFQSVDTESCCDEIDLHAGSSTSNSTVATLRGSDGGSVFAVPGDDALVRFTSDGSVSDHDGFQACARAVGTPNNNNNGSDCNRRVDVPFGGCQTFGLEDYENDMSCRWQFEGVGSNDLLQLEFTSIDTEECCDHVEVFDGSDELVTRLSGTRSGETLFVTGDSVVTFDSDGSVTRSGFTARVCAGGAAP